MKKIIFIVLGIFAATIAGAQSNLYFNNYWQDTYFINPASIDQYAPDWKFGLASKKQWAAVPGAPITAQANVMYCYEPYHLQAGLNFITDKIGYTYTTDIGLSYAYLIFFQQAQLNIGLGIHWQNIFYDKTQIVTEQGNDPAIDLLNDNWNKGKFNSDFGVEYVWNNPNAGDFLFGLAAKNFIPVNTPQENFAIFPNTNYLYGQFRSNNRDNYFPYSAKGNFDYSFAIAGIHTQVPQQEALLQGVFNANLHWNHDDYIFTLGLVYSTQTEAGIILGFDWVYNFSASLIYQYNWSYRQDIINPAGSFELLLTYKINPKSSTNKPCSRKGPSPCLSERKINTRCISCSEGQKNFEQQKNTKKR